ncbi:hypothetical protein ABEO75_06880, partial [Paenibacillus macerans]|uniref:hypothetical protein n=1 Tax=Paenibacillus macerans TaxID=44252 RepID=UPI003D2C947A
RDQRFHAGLLAVVTAAEWLKFHSCIDIHACSPPISTIHVHVFVFIIPNTCSLIKPKISPEPPHFLPFLFFSLFWNPCSSPIPCSLNEWDNRAKVTGRNTKTRNLPLHFSLLFPAPSRLVCRFFAAKVEL